MTEYELAYLFVKYRLALLTSLTSSVGIMSAFLLASTMAAPRLSTSLTWVFVGIYCIAMFIYLFSLNQDARNFAGLIEMVREASAMDNSNLKWHAAASTPKFVATVGHPLFLTLTLTAFLGSLYFFYLCRKGQFKWSLSQ